MCTWSKGWTHQCRKMIYTFWGVFITFDTDVSIPYPCEQITHGFCIHKFQIGYQLDWSIISGLSRLRVNIVQMIIRGKYLWDDNKNNKAITWIWLHKSCLLVNRKHPCLCSLSQPRVELSINLCPTELRLITQGSCLGLSQV